MNRQMGKSLLSMELFDEGPVVLFIWRNDVAWSVEAVSKNIEKLLGYKQEEFLSNSIVYANLIFKDDLAKVKEEVSKHATNQAKNFIHEPYRIQKSNGEFIWVKDTTTIIYEEGEITHFIGYIYDCTQEIVELENKFINNKLANIAQNIPGMIYLYQVFPDGRSYFPYTSDRLYDIYGISPEDARKDSSKIFSLTHPEDVERIVKSTKISFEELSIWEEEFRVLRPNQDIIWLKGVAKPEKQSDGSVLWYGYIFDITKTKEFEVKLQESENFLNQSQKNAEIGSYSLDLNTMLWKSSEALDELFGIDSSFEHSVNGWVNLIHPDDRDEMFIYFNQNVFQEYQKFDREYRIIRHNDQVVRWVHGIGKVEFDTMNNPVRMVGTIQDITQRHAFQKNLEEQKEEFEAIFKYSKDGIAIFDLNSKFLDFNDAYLEMTRFTREELYTKSCIELTVPEDIERSKEAMRKVIEDGFTENFEKSCLVKDDKILIINMTLSLMPDKKRIIAVAKNITHDRLIESQAKLASMGEMIGNIAHQWRQPLNVISALASGVAFKKEYGTLKDEDIIPNMETIIDQTNYLSKTIDDFRNFIKGDHIEDKINISELFDKTFSIVDSSLKNHYIEIVKDIDLDIIINGYENELIQAFINIINNAKDAMVANENVEDKYIFITAKSKDNCCEITINDNGGGIQLSVINRIFEPYFTTKHQSLGTGLGLAMAHKIITEMHNGTIKASNITYEYKGKEYTGASFQIVF